jgi:hypothetical protein
MKKYFKKNIKKLLSQFGKIINESSLSLHESQQRLAWEDSQKFIYENTTKSTRIFPDHWSLRDSIFENLPHEGLLFEFGVYKGKSINYFAKKMQEKNDSRIIYGFDSFKGFSEEWTGVEQKYSREHFDIGGGEVVVENNIRLIDGYIENTLPKFCTVLKDTDRVAFIHIDTDTYSPAKTILNALKGRLKKGTIILFDELAGYPNWRSHEYAALVAELDRSWYEYIGFATSRPKANLIKAAIKITRDI